MLNQFEQMLHVVDWFPLSWKYLFMYDLQRGQRRGARRATVLTLELKKGVNQAEMGRFDFLGKV